MRCFEDKYSGPTLTDAENDWVQAASAVLGDDLVGVVLFSSLARGEANASSDVDLLVVTSRRVPLGRRLYLAWDEVCSDQTVNPHFAQVPATVLSAGSLWYEIAIDGIVLLESGKQVSDVLRKIRKAIADRLIERKDAYGHGYWIKHGRETADAK